MSWYTLKLAALIAWYSAVVPPLFALAFLSWAFGDHDA